MKTLRSVNIPTLMFLVAGAWIMDRSPAWFTATRTAELPVDLGVSAATITPKIKPVKSVEPPGQPDISQWAPKVKHVPKMWVNTSTLYKGETLQLHFTTPNAPYLGLIDPKGRFFYLVFPAETVVGELKPLVESKSFIALKSLSINTGTLKADPYTYGVYANQPVFTRSGTYTFLLGENLHVDDVTFLDKASVRYINTPRPAQISPNSAF